MCARIAEILNASPKSSVRANRTEAISEISEIAIERTIWTRPSTRASPMAAPETPPSIDPSGPKTTLNGMKIARLMANERMMTGIA